MMMARRFVAKSAIQAHLLRSHCRQLSFPLSLSSRPYSESAPSRSTQDPQSSKHDNGYWKNEVRMNWKVWAKAATTGGFVDEHQRRSHESRRDSAIYETLKRGPIFSDSLDSHLPREALVDEVRKVVAPSDRSRGYSLIIGEHGTGKTSLVQLAVDNLKEPKGIAYVDMSNISDENLVPAAAVINAVQEALGWTLDPVLDPGNPLFNVFKVFSRVALKYREVHKVVPTLIIDNANKLPGTLLAQFQDYARKAADNKFASIVFVLSEGRIPRQRSSWSRHGLVLEIGDVSKDEALRYLKLRNVDDKLALQVYDFVGGRIVLLKYVADGIQYGSKFNDVSRALLNEAEGQLRIAGMLPEGKFHKQGKLIIAMLLKESAISNRTYWATLENEEIGEEVLQRNVFSHHYYTDDITFQSTPVQRYCELRARLWGG